jgi:hypothetical protein
VLEERVVLEDEAEVAVLGALAGHIFAPHEDRALVGVLEARHDAEHRALSPAARTEERDELPRLHFEGDVVDHAVRAEALHQMLRRDHGRG